MDNDRTVQRLLVAAVTKPGIAAWIAWNLAITALLTVALLFQGVTGSAVASLAALVLAAVAFVVRWGVNGVIWVRRRRMSQPAAAPCQEVVRQQSRR